MPLAKKIRMLANGRNIGALAICIAWTAITWGWNVPFWESTAAMLCAGFVWGTFYAS